jgi:hypothetical protein
MGKMKSRQKAKVKITVLGLIITSVLGVGLYQNRDQLIRNTTYGELIRGGASQRALLTLKQFKRQLRPYPVLKSQLSAAVALPGLQGVWTLNNQKQCVKLTTFDYQGVTASKRYVYLSAYDTSKTGNSVIFVLDKKQGNYIKTLVLPGKPHVGGVTYDSVSQILWVTGHQRKKAMLYGIGQYQINHDHFVKSHQAIHYDKKLSLPSIPKSSAVTLAESTLWIGYFNQQRSGKIQTYPITRHVADGGLSVGHEVAGVRDDDVQPETTQAGPKKIQGLTIKGQTILVSASYGNHDSRLIKYRLQGGRLREPTYIKLPPYLEQIHYDGNYIFALFESATAKYRRRTKTMMDRLVVIDMSSFDRYARPYQMK